MYKQVFSIPIISGDPGRGSHLQVCFFVFFSGPTLTWTLPFYKFLEAASEAATQKGIASSHTAPEKSADTGCWLVLYRHGLS